MDKQVNLLYYDAPEKISPSLETFIGDLIKMILEFAADPAAIILRNFNISDQDTVEFKLQQLQEQMDINHQAQLAYLLPIVKQQIELPQIQSRQTDFNAVRQQSNKTPFTRYSVEDFGQFLGKKPENYTHLHDPQYRLSLLKDEVAEKLQEKRQEQKQQGKYDFKVEKSLFNLQKTIQDLPNLMSSEYIAAVGPHHYIVSCVGGPVTILSQYTSQQKKLETGNQSCQSHCITFDKLALGCNNLILFYDLVTLENVSSIPQQNRITFMCSISKYLLVVMGDVVNMFFAQQDVPVQLESFKSPVGQINSVKVGLFAGDFLLSGFNGLMYSSIDPITNKVKPGLMGLQQFEVLDCEPFEPDQFAAVVASQGKNKQDSITIYVLKRQDNKLVHAQLFQLPQTTPQIDFRLKRALRSNLLLIFLDNRLLAVDPSSGKYAQVIEENRVYIQGLKFCDWVVRDASVRLLLLCKHEEIAFVHKLDFATELFVKGLQSLLAI